VLVQKRDGVTYQAFDSTKIQRAIAAAWKEARGEVDERSVEQVTKAVEYFLTQASSTVEQIQDLVEVNLMRAGHHAVAKAYILYRQKRTEARGTRLHPDPNAVADYIHPSKYSRFDEFLGRRELYGETVDRVADMHLRRFQQIFVKDPDLHTDVLDALDCVEAKYVLPSMRVMQFAGAAIEKQNNRVYNCCFSLVDRPMVFGEALYLLLCGSGVGFSVQFQHVDKLPPLKRISDHVVHHTIDDSIEGWGDALTALVESYMVTGDYVEFNYSKIRAKGSPLKTSGGKAPGHMKLKQALEQIRGILLNAVGRKLRPIECHDILCLGAEAAVSGGIRRSAMISLFSLEDGEMMYAKTGRWYDTHPWRQNSNNSVVLKRDEVRKSQFQRVFEMTKEWGEPGIDLTNDYDYGFNPCAEIGLNPVLTIDDEVAALIDSRLKAGKRGPGALPTHGEKITGWAMCNLCEMNAAEFKTREDFIRAAKAATILGTMQATYTDMPYLGWVSEVLVEREALLGIGMTGMLDSPKIACDPELQREVAGMVVEWNKDYAARFGVRPGARLTCVKPSGTTSLELGCVASGHHAHHARRYIRRVVANELEPVFQYFKSINPHMCVRKPNGDWVIEFPVEAPDGAIVKADLGAIQFLEMVKSTQKNWVIPGTARPESSPGLTHNVSNTVHVKADEWEEVANYLWENRDSFTGVSLLPVTGDKQYAFAPCEAITTPADEVRWNQLLAGYKPVDYSQMRETEDGTALTGEAACAGGACLV
jgi:ribonucleoside-diphosphate reductase alpha chain